MRFVAIALLASALLAGCGGPVSPGCERVSGVVECTIHIGWNADHKSQYMTPTEIRVSLEEKVRFVVINDDDPNTDYNHKIGSNDNFHDVALLDYDGDGDGTKEDIEHEAPAGGGPVKTLLKGKDYFLASTKGTFDIICEVRTTPSHAELGMKAKFIVE